MKLTRPRIPSTLLLVLSLTLPGCGSGGPTKYTVSGTVTFEGKPVPVGTIHFTPMGGGGAVGVADIFDGRFKTQPDKGVPAGEYVALVRGHAAPDGEPDVEEGLPPITMGLPLFDEVRIPIDLPAADSKHEFVLPLALEG